jgi:hypothetical protein
MSLLNSPSLTTFEQSKCMILINRPLLNIIEILESLSSIKLQQTEIIHELHVISTYLARDNTTQQQPRGKFSRQAMPLLQYAMKEIILKRQGKG